MCFQRESFEMQENFDLENQRLDAAATPIVPPQRNIRVLLRIPSRTTPSTQRWFPIYIQVLLYIVFLTLVFFAVSLLFHQHPRFPCTKRSVGASSPTAQTTPPPLTERCVEYDGPVGDDKTSVTVWAWYSYRDGNKESADNLRMKRCRFPLHTTAAAAAAASAASFLRSTGVVVRADRCTQQREHPEQIREVLQAVCDSLIGAKPANACLLMFFVTSTHKAETEVLPPALTADYDELEKLTTKAHDIDELLDSLEGELHQRKAELDQREAELDQRKAELDQREAELDQRKAELDQREAELDQRKAELDQREAEIEEEEGQIPEPPTN